MEPMRILHVVNILNRGGMESRLMDVYRHLDHERYQYDFYIESGTPGMFDEEVINLGGRVFLSKNKLKHNVPSFRAFYDFLKLYPEYKIIYAYNQWSGFYLKEAKRCGVPHRIANARTSIQTKSLKNSIKNIVKFNVNKYSTLQFAVSKKAAVWLFGEKVVNSGRVKVWPNAIDTEKFKFSKDIRLEVRNELGLGDEFTVIHVGNIKFEKNHPFLLRVFSEIKKSEHKAKLLLIGNGNIDNLVPQINELGIENSVICLGVRQDIPRLLQAGDVFIFPSFYEGFPGAVLEAEASGLPCIISDSITDEVILTEHIVAMSLNDGPENWAKSACKIINTNRPEAWRKIKKAGYDITDLVNNNYKLYEKFTIIQDKY